MNLFTALIVLGLNDDFLSTANFPSVINVSCTNSMFSCDITDSSHKLPVVHDTDTSTMRASDVTCSDDNEAENTINMPAMAQKRSGIFELSPSS